MSSGSNSNDGRLDNISVKQTGGNLSSVTFVEDSTSVVLDSDLTLFDAEISEGLDNYTGTTLVLNRNGGADSEDVFSATGNLEFDGAILKLSGTSIGFINKNSDGELQLAFSGASVTEALVNETLQSIAYENASDTPPSNVQIKWEFNDSNSGTQGTGGAKFASGSTMVIIQNAADLQVIAPDTHATNEDTPLIFSGVNRIEVDDGIAADTPIRVSLSVANGTLSLSEATGITFVEGSNETGSFVIDGFQSDINNALNFLTYTPDANYNSTAILNISTSIGADLVGNYTFEGGNANDHVAGVSYDGTLNGNAATTTDVERGEVLLLDGDADFVDLDTKFGEPADVTLAAWVNFSSAATNPGEVISIGNEVALRVDDSNGGVTAFFYDGTDFNFIASGISVADDAWHHVAFTFDDAANTQTLFIDGVAVASGNYTGSIDYNTTYSNSRIGAHVDDAVTGFDFNGLIDDARVYSRALSFDEIAALATDQTEASNSVAITVNPVNDAPVLPTNTAVDVVENTTLVGNFAGIDPDGDGLTYSLIGADADLLNINSATGEVVFAAAPDAETPLDADGDNVYELTVVATDDGAGTLTDSQNVSVTVTDENEFAVSTPTDVDAAVNQVDENVAVGTSVGLTADAFDLDTTDNTVTYTLTSNLDGLFQIDANTGEVTTLGAIDRETHGVTRAITVEATSSDGSTASQSFDIAISDVNEFGLGPISDVDAAENQIEENAAVGSSVGITASATDADATNNFISYSLQDNDGGRFQIDVVTGEITVAGNIDFESDGASRSIVVRAESSDGSFSDQAFAVAVNDVNETPTVTLTGAVFTVAEGADTSGGIRIADIIVTDDALGLNELSLSGIDAGVFEIVGDQLRLRSGTNLDFESKTQYEVTVEVDDRAVGATPDDAVSLTLNVTNGDDEAPVILSGQQFSVDENSAEGTVVGSVVVANIGAPNAANALIDWVIVDGAESGTFTIDSTTGQISVAENAELDFEQTDSYVLKVAVSNGNQISSPESVTINLQDVNDAPVARNVAFQVDQFVSLEISTLDMVSNDEDQDGDSLSTALVSSPSHGTLTMNADGSMIYTPLENYFGRDSFTYQVFDGTVAGGIATVEIVVNPLGISGDDPRMSDYENSSNEPTDQDESSETEMMTDSGDSNESMMISKDALMDSPAVSLDGTIGNMGSNRFVSETDNSVTQVVGEVVLNDEVVLRDSSSSEVAGSFSQSSARHQRYELRFDQIARATERAALANDAPITWLPLTVVLPGRDAGSSASEESAEQKLDEILTGTYVVSTATFSVGYVLWMIRGGSLLASFSSTLPMWTSFDPLAVVAAGENEENSEDNESLIEIVNANEASD